MVGLFVLAAISRCASVQLCPSNEEIRAAVQAYDDALIYEIVARAPEDQIVLAHSAPIKRISDVICGDSLAADVHTVTCKFTVTYASKKVFKIAKMARTADGWRIEQALAVTCRHR